MTGIPQPHSGVVTPAPVLGCPPWCVSRHGAHRGEEDWVHSSAPVLIADGVEASACMTVDPVTGAVDGPHVLVGSRELTPAQAAALATELLALGRAAEEVSPPATV